MPYGYSGVSRTSAQEKGSCVEVGKPRGRKALDTSDTGHKKVGKAEKGW